ncbi:MAG: hypothetical protein O7G85_10585 [Planctomycetota bacterium]|nr:hypothetical protein [Planctomycetota bacterium]
MTKQTHHLGTLLIGLILACSLGGCSTIERDGKSASSNAMAMNEEVRNEIIASDLVGRWKGTWTSDFNGHTGTLRCIISVQPPEPPDAPAPPDAPKTQNSPDQPVAFLARYLATYGGSLTYEYDVIMHVRREGDTYHFSAEADLGPLAGGVFTYKGTVVGNEFRSTYTSAGDHGVFEMNRLK